MVVYYFNPRIVDKLTKIRVIGGLEPNYNCRHKAVTLHPDDDPRAYSGVETIWGINQLDVSANEGVVYRHSFWLNEEDDERAKEIYYDWFKKKFKKETERINKLKRLGV